VDDVKVTADLPGNIKKNWLDEDKPDCFYQLMIIRDYLLGVSSQNHRIVTQ
jgi:hypothetical protein